MHCFKVYITFRLIATFHPAKTDSFSKFAISFIIDPEKSSSWNCFPSQQVSVGPFTIIKSIDALTESLADKLSAEKRGFTISTKNIGNDTSISVLEAWFCF